VPAPRTPNQHPLERPAPPLDSPRSHRDSQQRQRHESAKFSWYGPKKTSTNLRNTIWNTPLRMLPEQGQRRSAHGGRFERLGLRGGAAARCGKHGCTGEVHPRDGEQRVADAQLPQQQKLDEQHAEGRPQVVEAVDLLEPRAGAAGARVAPAPGANSGTLPQPGLPG